MTGEPPEPERFEGPSISSPEGTSMPPVPISRHCTDSLPRHEESKPPVSSTCAVSRSVAELLPAVTVIFGMRVSPAGSVPPQGAIGIGAGVEVAGGGLRQDAEPPAGIVNPCQSENCAWHAAGRRRRGRSQGGRRSDCRAGSHRRSPARRRRYRPFRRALPGSREVRARRRAVRESEWNPRARGLRRSEGGQGTRDSPRARS